MLIFQFLSELPNPNSSFLQHHVYWYNAVQPVTIVLALHAPELKAETLLCVCVQFAQQVSGMMTRKVNAISVNQTFRLSRFVSTYMHA